MALSLEAALLDEVDIALEPFVNARLNDIAREEGLTEGFALEVSRGAACGDILRVVMRGPRNRRPASKSLIVKIPPQDEWATHLNSISLFSAEVRAYEHLLTTFVQFQRDKGISPADGFYNVSKCYSIACDNDRGRYVLIMEDLRDSGYTMLDQLAPVDIAHGRLVARELGRFHGVSMALSDQRPDVFEPYAQHGNIFLRDLEKRSGVREMYETALREAVDVLEDQDKALKRKLQSVSQNFMAHMRACLHSKLDEPMRVIAHGDFWNNNIMFKHVSYC